MPHPASNRRAIVTVITHSYLPYALALAESVREYQPDADFYVCLVDRPHDDALPDAGIEWFGAADLQIAGWKRFAFQYTAFELSCALKPIAMRHVIDQGYAEVVYLDADMRLFGPLIEVFDALEKDSIVLTPHLLKPFPRDGARPSEDLFLLAGTFNTGFVAVRDTPVTDAFLDWWSQKHESDCFKDLAASIFVDQKWVSLVPGLFEQVCILRNPAYNTGHWTLPQFELSRDAESRACIGGQPIALFHFSNLSPDEPGEFAHCQTRTTLDKQPVLRDLVATYHTAILRQRASHPPTGYQFERLSDGTPIKPEWREAVRRKHPLLDGVRDPFDLDSAPQLVSIFTSLESKARKWRKDWRLKGAVVPEAPPPAKRIEKRVKTWLTAIGLRRKAA